ncbi:MAG: hypothetical protein LIO75_04290 [Lachnospiraceae bacterium]|nr:hypothetical protein [Lachnospiraceae bacterium]
MNTRIIIVIVVIAALVAMIIALYLLAKRNEKKRDEQQAAIDEMKQNCTMLIIDKKKMRLKDSGLPRQVIDEAPWYSKRSKLPIVKVKIGPKIFTMVADADIFDYIPVKKEVKATVSGIYITDVRGIRGPLDKPEKKKGLLSRFMGGR